MPQWGTAGAPVQQQACDPRPAPKINAGGKDLSSAVVSPADCGNVFQPPKALRQRGMSCRGQYRPRVDDLCALTGWPRHVSDGSCPIRMGRSVTSFAGRPTPASLDMANCNRVLTGDQKSSRPSAGATGKV